MTDTTHTGLRARIEALEVALQMIAEQAESPEYRSLEVGFRHSPLTKDEVEKRLRETCTFIAQDARSALLATPPAPQETAGEAVEAWTQVGFLKEKLRQAEEEAKVWKERAMSLRTSPTPTAAPTDNAALVEAWKAGRDAAADEVFARPLRSFVKMSKAIREIEPPAALASRPAEATSRDAAPEGDGA